MSHHRYYAHTVAPGTTTSRTVAVGAAGVTANLPGQIAPGTDTELIHRIARTRPGGGYVALSINATLQNVGGSNDQQIVRALSPHGVMAGSYTVKNRRALQQRMHMMYVPVAAALMPNGQLGTLTLTLTSVNRQGVHRDYSDFAVAFPITELSGGQCLVIEKVGKFTGWIINGVPQMERITWTVVCSDNAVDRSHFSDVDLLRSVHVRMRGENLPKVDTFGSIDPFVVIERPAISIVPGAAVDPASPPLELYRSEGYSRNPNPAFKEAVIDALVRATYGHADTMLTFRLMDMNLTGDTYVGEAKATMSELLGGAELALDLHSKKDKREQQMQKSHSKLYVQVVLVDTPESQGAAEKQNQPPLAVGGSIGGSGDDGQSLMKNTAMMRSRKMTVAEVQQSILTKMEPATEGATTNEHGELHGNIDEYLEAMKTNPDAMHSPDMEIDYTNLWDVLPKQ